MPTIETRHERRRGCGYRKQGGVYLVSTGLLRPCGRLPIPLIVCPTCHAGVKPSRGWTWINFAALAADAKCEMPEPSCRGCLLAPAENTCDGWEVGRAGLIWVGGSFYKRPEDFVSEAAHLGVSRRVTAIPRDFKVGETVVLFAHREAITNPDGTYTAGIFHAFRPSAIEYVVKDDDDDETLDRLEERGFTLIRVIPVDANGKPIKKEDAERLTDRPIDDSTPLLDGPRRGDILGEGGADDGNDD